jgi:hypothetical protein
MRCKWYQQASLLYQTYIGIKSEPITLNSSKWSLRRTGQEETIYCRTGALIMADKIVLKVDRNKKSSQGLRSTYKTLTCWLSCRRVSSCWLEWIWLCSSSSLSDYEVHSTGYVPCSAFPGLLLHIVWWWTGITRKWCTYATSAWTATSIFISETESANSFQKLYTSLGTSVDQAHTVSIKISRLCWRLYMTFYRDIRICM